MSARLTVSVQEADFDFKHEHTLLVSGDKGVGAVVAFIGMVRDLNLAEDVVALELEHYPGMTEKALAGIVEQARGRWQVLGCTVIHRYGALKPTDQIVFVAVASGHRADAFAACEFIMDFLKTQAPF